MDRKFKNNGLEYLVLSYHSTKRVKVVNKSPKATHRNLLLSQEKSTASNETNSSEVSLRFEAKEGNPDVNYSKAPLVDVRISILFQEIFINFKIARYTSSILHLFS